jgi:RNA polymerase primary sigma factor
MDIYLQEVDKIQLLSSEEQSQLAVLAKKGDNKAKEKLIKSNLRFVVSLAKQYQGQGMPLEDLVSEGNFGLIRSIDKFNPNLGHKFLTYAGWWIRQSILQALNEQNRQVRLPMNRVNLLGQERKTESMLQQKLNRHPTQDEVLTEMNVEGNEIVRQFSFSYTIDDPEDRSALESLENVHSPRPDQDLLTESLKKEIEMVLKKLNEREREILKMCYGIGYEHAFTLEEIGEKLNLTRERIRQLREKALKQLRRLNRRKQLENLKD